MQTLKLELHDNGVLCNGRPLVQRYPKVYGPSAQYVAREERWESPITRPAFAVASADQSKVLVFCRNYVYIWHIVLSDPHLQDLIACEKDLTPGITTGAVTNDGMRFVLARGKEITLGEKDTSPRNERIWAWPGYTRRGALLLECIEQMKDCGEIITLNFEPTEQDVLSVTTNNGKNVRLRRKPGQNGELFLVPAD